MSLARLTAARESLLDGVGPAVAANQALAVALLNQETGVRGYALSRDPAFLDPYRDGVADEAAALAGAARAPRGRAEAALVEDVARAGQTWRTGYAELEIAAAAAGGTCPRPGHRQGALRRHAQPARPAHGRARRRAAGLA